ncbi:hypothetical protein BJ999_001471 [Actinomadura citrea]|uniref:Uncharacterized protein n=1 Tax=Actinomadura citrea TaxID=46158 RepID=A0A7Y9G718_9ACTN|nr:hypothetical protein [Actinomadura citrea]GGT78094.1 hypothetical protein GCM10010177_40740 [Actinomadura citrea]
MPGEPRGGGAGSQPETMQSRTTGWVAGAILLLIVVGTGSTGLPESGSTSGGSNGPAAPPAGTSGKGQVTSRLWQTDHWKIFLQDGSTIDLSQDAGRNCSAGSVYPQCKG